MSRPAIAVAIALAGCSFHSGGGDKVIDAPQVFDVPVDLPLDKDSDGDGIVDGLDNCPTVSNADQHDEDKDGVGDACDPCPQIPHEDLTDTDGDHIPDACDPHPNTSGDVFDGLVTMAGTQIPTGWNLGEGTLDSWVVSGDVMTLTADNNEQMLLFETNVAHHVIDMGVDLQQDTASGSNPSFMEVLTDTDSTGTNYNGCGVRVDPGQGARELFHDLGGTFTLDDSITTDKPTDHDSVRIVLIQDAAAETCHIPGPSGDHELDATQMSRGDEHVGILGRNITAKIRYVALYHF
jgi:hypothetical protein